eukprot:COSAG02_NODE_120_length_35326_cov_39.000823_6_plen_189_part_00
MGDTVARPDAWCQRRARRSELNSAVGGGAGCRVAALGVDGGDATASPVLLGALSCLRCTLLPAPGSTNRVALGAAATRAVAGPSAEAEAERCARTGVADEGRAGAFAGSATRACVAERVRSGWLGAAARTGERAVGTKKEVEELGLRVVAFATVIASVSVSTSGCGCSLTAGAGSSVSPERSVSLARA